MNHFEHNLNQYFDKAKRPLPTTPVNRLQRIAEQAGYITGSRPAAFFVMAYSVFTDELKYLNMTKPQRIAYAKACTEVMFDSLHGRAVSLQTAMATACSKYGYSSTSVTVVINHSLQLIREVKRKANH